MRTKLAVMGICLLASTGTVAYFAAPHVVAALEGVIQNRNPARFSGEIQVLWTTIVPLNRSSTDDAYWLSEVIETQNGQYLARGTHDTGGLDKTNIYVVKSDSEGRILWEKQYGGRGYDTADYLRDRRDGTYTIIGDRTPATETVGLFLRIDESGNVLSEETLSGPWMTRIWSCRDDGVILEGFDSASKFDQDGHKIWDLDLGSLSDVTETGNLMEARDGGLYVLWSDIVDPVRWPTLLTRFGANLNKLWTVELGVGSGGMLFECSNGGVLLVAPFWEPDRIRIMRVDAQGHLVSNTYGNATRFLSSWFELDRGGFMVTGGFREDVVPKRGQVAPQNRAFILRFRETGELLWSREMKVQNKTRLNKGTETEDGGYIFPVSQGYEWDYAPGYLLKIDESGNTVWEYHAEWQPNSIARCGEGEYLVAGNLGNDAVLVKLVESKTPVPEANLAACFIATIVLLAYTHQKYGSEREAMA